MTTMRYKDYVAQIDYDEESRLFHGRVVNIQDVVNFWGGSAEELEREFATSMDDYEELCKEQGIEPSKPFSGKFQVRMTPTQHRMLASAAALHGKSLNAWIVRVLEREAEREIHGSSEGDSANHR